MASKQRTAAQAALTGPKTPQASPFAGNIPNLNQADFKKQYDNWLREQEALKPFHELREIEDRIRKGEAKLRAAEQRGIDPERADYKEGVEKLAALRARRDELTKTAQIPMLGWNTAHNVLRASRGWGLPLGSYYEIHVPGVFSVRVDLAESEIPF